jgi:hypothetical protein
VVNNSGLVVGAEMVAHKVRWRWLPIALMVASAVAAVTLAIIWSQPPAPPAAAVERLHKIQPGMSHADVEQIMKGLEGTTYSAHIGPPLELYSRIVNVSEDWAMIVSFDRSGKVVGRDIALQGRLPWYKRLLESLRKRIPPLRSLPF